MFTPEALKPHLIERFAVDSSNIKSVGYEGGVCVVEFSSGDVFAYGMPAAEFEAFAAAESKGKYFAAHIRGKVSGSKLTGQCPKCGSRPEFIGETCSDCGAAKAVPVVSKREAKRLEERP